jgi:hypothetical protein
MFAWRNLVQRRTTSQPRELTVHPNGVVPNGAFLYLGGYSPTLSALFVLFGMSRGKNRCLFC